MFTVVSLFLSFLINFHLSYFAFAEMEYKKENQQIELSLLLTCHDIEKEWFQSKVIESELSKISHENSNLNKMENELNNSFIIEYQQKKIPLRLLDFETKKDGTVIFYLFTENIELNKEINITFNTLMNTFPKQQNKLTFIQNGNKKTFVFLKNSSKQKIEIQ